MNYIIEVSEYNKEGIAWLRVYDISGDWVMSARDEKMELEKDISYFLQKGEEVKI